MERRFSCTACGKCCYGMLPLTIEDALAHADKFPLIITWTPIRQGGRSYEATAELGLTIALKKRKMAAVRIAPAAYIPPSLPCPELTEEGLCGIHETKPQRCRTMPFSAYRDAADQDDLMIPRAGWLCDTSDEAPLVYRDKALLEGAEFKLEKQRLLRDAVILKAYGDWLLDVQPALKKELYKVALKPSGGQVLVAFSSLIPRLPKVDIYHLAEQQLPVMTAYAEKTAGDPQLKEFHRRYTDGAADWQKVLSARP